MFEVLGFGRLLKLLVGGLHGNEAKITVKALQELSRVRVKKGEGSIVQFKREIKIRQHS